MDTRKHMKFIEGPMCIGPYYLLLSSVALQGLPMLNGLADIANPLRVIGNTKHAISIYNSSANGRSREEANRECKHIVDNAIFHRDGVVDKTSLQTCIMR